MALNRAFSYIRSLIGIKGADGTNIASNSNPIPVSGDMTALNNLIVQQYDALRLTYNLNGEVETVRYYQGGINGTLVATLTLGYDALSNLTSVART